MYFRRYDLETPAEQQKTKQTNADKYFRNATDEELVNMILKFDVCGQIPLKKCYSHNGNCESCILDWLKQEVENDD